MPDPLVVQNLRIPPPGTDKVGKCPAVAPGAGAGPRGGALSEFLGGDVPLGPWNP